MPSFDSSLRSDPAATASTAQPTAQPSLRHDLVVVGGTPAGIACAVRAAREGLSVLLVNWNEHLGGILSSSLAVWDTQWEGNRSPVYDEVRAAILGYYLTTYGVNSSPYRDALPSTTGHLIGRYEPRVAEKILTEIVAREKGITVLRSHLPVGVVREASLLRSLLLRPTEGGPDLAVQAPIFSDCTYEGDLAALAQVPYRVGRESRAEFGEPHGSALSTSTGQ